jgi:UTP--glucose-1-phosphate uridylyltransferase
MEENMTDTSTLKYLPAFISKMTEDNLPAIVINVFSHYYRKVITGETGMISDRDIEAVPPGSLARLEQLEEYIPAGRKAVDEAVRIILNGGLGTSMGLTGPKSLLEVREGKSFLEILLKRASQFQVPLALMNSFSTHAETLKAFERLSFPVKPLTFLQHKFPKILQDLLCPASWPQQPELEWNPPGHGDIYTALVTSGMLDHLLAQGRKYAFISNSDNLGATLDEGILGYFAQNSFPFLMEVAQRTPADVKGGHLARYKEGGLLLRESAQCPEKELNAFQDINRYHFFNTNNIWVNLVSLKQLLEKQGAVHLPMIVNPKTLDPRNENSPAVFQVETAMGSAISLFKEAAAVCVPRSRFFPVKKCSDLLAVRSDYFIFENDELHLNPDRRSDALKITLDSAFYKKIDQFDARFPEGAPSLAECESLSVEGDVIFEKNIAVKGRAVVRNISGGPQTIPAGTMIEGLYEMK